MCVKLWSMYAKLLFIYFTLSMSYHIIHVFKLCMRCRLIYVCQTMVYVYHTIVYLPQTIFVMPKNLCVLNYVCMHVILCNTNSVTKLSSLFETEPNFLTNAETFSRFCMKWVHFHFELFSFSSMVFRVDGCSFHVAHEWCKQGLFTKKNWIWRLFRCNQMPSTNRNVWFTLCVRIVKWATI